MHLDLWLTIQITSAEAAVSLGSLGVNSLELRGELAKGFKVASDEGRDLSRLPWAMSFHRGGEFAVSETAIGVAFPVLDPDETAGDDLFAVEATVDRAQFDRMLQLVNLASSQPRIALCVSGLEYGKEPAGVTRVWRLPDTLPLVDARLIADLISQYQQ